MTNCPHRVVVFRQDQIYIVFSFICAHRQASQYGFFGLRVSKWYKLLASSRNDSRAALDIRSMASSPEDNYSKSSSDSGSTRTSVSDSMSDGAAQLSTRHFFTFMFGRWASATAPGSPDLCSSREITGDALQKVMDPVDFRGLQWSDPGIRQVCNSSLSSGQSCRQAV